jgi:hypothetical protein
VRSMCVIAGPGGENTVIGPTTAPISPLTLRHHYDMGTVRTAFQENLHRCETASPAKACITMEPATRYGND